MRATALISTTLVLAVTVAGCGWGPDDPDAALTAACDRQIAEIEEMAEEGNTPVAPSTEERLDEITLVECAGQQVKVVAASEGDQEEGEGDASADEGDEGDKQAEEPAEAVELDPEARSLFASTCGGCHTLSDADTSGAVGPNLDDTELDAAGIAGVIEDGQGAMPAGLLEGDDATAVAEYVAGAAAAE